MKENRSLFWPLTLIASGLIWLLVSMGRIPSSNLWALTQIWPYVLIALGLGLILRSLWRPLGTIVTALVVIGATLAVIFAPQLGWDRAPSWGDWNVQNSFTGGIAGSGTLKSEARQVSGFDALEIRYPANIVIRQGSSESLSIEAEDNLLPQITTEVRSGTLFIENNVHDFAKRVDPTKPIKITITVKELQRIDFSTAGNLTVEGLKGDSLSVALSGAGDITLNKLQVERLEARLSGAGKMTASGSSENADVTISGLGDFNGTELTCQKADVRISGAGTITLRVEDDLNAHISGAGSVNYYGSPNVTKTISGAGDIKKIGE